jgi:hypothetical protein
MYHPQTKFEQAPLVPPLHTTLFFLDQRNPNSKEPILSQAGIDRKARETD